MAVDNLGTNDRAILAPQVYRAMAESLGFTAAQDIHLPQVGGVCHRAATKWAGCKVQGAPFKSEGMNTAKIDAKFDEYFAAQAKAPAAPGQRSGHSAANVEFIEKWLSSFTDADGTEHSNAVSVGKPQYRRPSDLLARQPLAEGEVMIMSVIARNPDGSAAGHTMALSGGPRPQLFDSGAQTVYDFKGEDAGRSMERYYEIFAPGAKLDWALTRVTSNSVAVR